MKVLVLGADGYLGWPTSMNLANNGHDVIAVDNYSKRLIAKQTNSEALVENPNLEARAKDFKKFFDKEIIVEIGDLTDYPFVERLFKEYQPDAVVHYGEQPSGPYSLIGQKEGQFTLQNNLIGTHNILWAMVNHAKDCQLVKLGCYDDKTEVLTDNGWKLFKDLKKSDKVMTLDSNTEEMKFDSTTAIVEYPYKGQMLQIETRSVDFCITPNHRVVYRTGLNKGLSDIKIDRADEIDSKNIYIPRGGKWNGELIEEFTIPSLETRGPGGRFFVKNEIKKEALNWMKFFGWYLSEGTIKFRNGEPTEIRIPQSYVKKEEYCNEIEELLLELDINFYKTPVKEDGTVCFEISDNHLSKYLMSFGKSSEKFIPKEIKNLHSSLLKPLLESLIKGDGHVNSSGTAYYFTNSKKLADDVQEIALKCGIVGNISVDNHRGNPNYRVTLGTTNTDTNVNPNSKKSGGVYNWVDYNGTVYCCSVPTGIIMVRRNGKIGWSGNTMGEYGTPNIDIEEGWLEIKHNGRKDTLLFPRAAGSLYHTTKVLDTDLIWFFVRMFDLRVTDLMQGPVYGIETPETIASGLYTSFYYDDIFGTIINRFVTQAVAGIPLTVYGKGGQTRGYLNIKDTLQCVKLVVEKPADKGELRILNQITESFSANELAERVKVAGDNRGFKVEIQHIENPRKEAEDHYYNVKHTGLLELGLKPHFLTPETIQVMLNYVANYKNLIDKDKIYPRVSWFK